MAQTIDISSLGTLNPVQPIDLSIVPEAPAKKEFSFPKAGVYEVRAPESFPLEAFSLTQSGNLGARVDPTILGPSNEGYEVRFQRIYQTVYTDPRTGLETSGIAQYLQAFGVAEKLDGTGEQAANLIASTAGQTAKAYINWEIDHRESGFKLRGMKNFPKDENGNYQPWIDSEDVKDENGNPKRLWARAVVTKWIPKGQS
ncbi:MAG: hypothetical protein AB7J46_06620 [Candidatus Altimarinota bacterium]